MVITCYCVSKKQEVEVNRETINGFYNRISPGLFVECFFSLNASIRGLGVSFKGTATRQAFVMSQSGVKNAV